MNDTWPSKTRTLAMIFEKQSTSTRISFEAGGLHQLGGAMRSSHKAIPQAGVASPSRTPRRSFSRMCDVVMIRTFEQGISSASRGTRRAGDQRSQ